MDAFFYPIMYIDLLIMTHEGESCIPAAALIHMPVDCMVP